MNPLTDISARTLCVGDGAPIAVAIDALLRMHADTKRWQTPVTIYLGVGAGETNPLTAPETVQFCSVAASVRSPIHTVGIGILRGFEWLILAAGNRGHRHLLPQALICTHEISPDELPLPNGSAGLTNHSLSLREQARDLVAIQVQCLARSFGITQHPFRAPQIMTAQRALELGFADHLVPRLAPQRSHDTNVDHAPTYS